jgi:hypothetical protein
MMKNHLILIMFLLAGCGTPPQGPKGDPGPMGPTGPSGAAGPAGAPGANGSSCSVSQVSASSAAPNGGSLIKCSDGTQSLIVNGVDGRNGTLVTPIQFCPGTPSYPSTFPEVGFCIEGDIYAVYSANDGFLTKIEPGTWESNAVGSRCNFHVGSNCTVTR